MGRLRVLLTGASGFLGAYLVAELEQRTVECVTAGRSGADLLLDLADPEAIREAVRLARPDRVLHAAALSSLAGCEAAPEQAAAVNEVAAGVLAEAVGGALLFVSTDLVFDGDGAPYRASDPPRPRGVYGRTKAAGEERVRQAGGRVVRVPLLFGRSLDGRRGATDMIRLAREPVVLFTNETRTPLHARDAARSLVEQALGELGPGILQLTGPERLSRYELGRRFVAQVGLDPERLVPGECRDPLRPRDVSLVSDWSCGRSLEAALAES
ncbi:MAG: SDR family oxidoreductase [Myxococcota bacterium]